MNNNISFTGFNNLFIGKKLDKRFGAYLRSDGQLAQGEKKYAQILIKCDLTDDAKGADLTDFKTVLDKCQDNYTARVLKQKSPNSIRFLTTRCMAKDEETGEKIFNTNFELNGVKVQPNDRKILPLFTYLAKLTRKLKCLPEISEDRIKYLDFCNKGIAQEATNFIENL